MVRQMKKRELAPFNSMAYKKEKLGLRVEMGVKAWVVTGRTR